MSTPETTVYPLFVVGRHAIALIEREIVEHDRVLELRVDGQSRGELRLLRYYQPGVVVGTAEVAVWGGGALYLAPLMGEGLRQYDQDDEVHVAYPIAGLWCLVRETSVTLFDPATGRETARYDHPEITLRHEWSGDRLVYDDFQARRFALRVLTNEGQLFPITSEQ